MAFPVVVSETSKIMTKPKNRKLTKENKKINKKNAGDKLCQAEESNKCKITSDKKQVTNNCFKKSFSFHWLYSRQFKGMFTFVVLG